MSEPNEAKSRRKELLADLLEGDAWRHVVVKVLMARLREQEMGAMRATTIEDLRIHQGAHRVLQMLLQDPHGFFEEKD